MEQDNNNHRPVLSKVDSEISEDRLPLVNEEVDLVELTWDETVVTGLQLRLGTKSEPYAAVQGELLFCAGTVTISWQYTKPAEELELPVLAELSVGPSPVETGGQTKLTKKERKEQKLEQKEREQKAAIKQQKATGFSAQLQALHGRHDATIEVAEVGEVRVMQLVHGEKLPQEIRFTYLTRTRPRAHARYRRTSSAVARWARPPKYDSGERWLVHPGAMTGDLWHLAAAMVFDRRIRMLLAWFYSNKTDAGNANALRDLLYALGVEKQRVVSFETSGQAQESSLGNRQARELAPEQILKAIKFKRGNPLCGHTWASTSILVDQVLLLCDLPSPDKSFAQRLVAARAEVQAKMREIYTKACKQSKEFDRYKQQYDEVCLTWLAKLKPEVDYILVNMRWVGEHGQNPQHNMTESRFAQIVTAARRRRSKRPVEVIRIGRPELWAKDAFAWLGIESYKNQTAVDIYAETSPDLAEVVRRNKLFQAYFWLKVYEYHEQSKNVGFIGGRSGGMDIASFLGILTASFDRVDPTDPNYMRLHWAAPFNTIISLVDGGKALDDGALAAWFAGVPLVPVLQGDPVAAEPVQTLEQYTHDNRAYDALWYPR